jgi:hypothetical protein
MFLICSDCRRSVQGAMEAYLDHTNRRIDSLVMCALHRRTLRLSCRSCPHVRLLDAVPVWFLFERKGWSGFIQEVPARFYCAACLRDAARKVTRPRLVITNDAAPPPTREWPYPDERVWKRLVSRYRS